MTPFQTRHQAHRAAIASYEAARVAATEAARRTIATASTTAQTATDREVARFEAEQAKVEARMVAEAHAKLADPVAAYVANPTRAGAVAIANTLRALESTLAEEVGAVGGQGDNALATDLAYVAFAKVAIARNPGVTGNLVRSLLNPAPGVHPGDACEKLRRAVLSEDPHATETGVQAVEAAVSYASRMFGVTTGAGDAERFGAIASTRAGPTRVAALAALSASKRHAEFATLASLQRSRLYPAAPQPEEMP